MPHGKDALFGTAGKAAVGEVPHEQGALSNIARKVSTEEGKVVLPLEDKTAGGGEGLWKTQWSTKPSECPQLEIALL